ncbi:MAG: 50S ribosomal protein L6 [Phycisphaerae bacterium]|nr:50S ribosomal protein L6 [Phycisphaerae bacterium]
MSRIGKKPVPVPAGVKVAVDPRSVRIEGPKGTLTLSVPAAAKVKWDEKAKQITVEPVGDVAKDSSIKAHWGSTRAHLANMIVGVTKGYEKTLEIVGVGWQATLAGANLKLQIGFANPIVMQVPRGVNVVVEKGSGDSQVLRVNGADKGAVGMFASAIRANRKPEPYQGKGIRYQGEIVKRKQGKQFGAAGA